MSFLAEPLRFERHFVEKVWGGRSLERVPGIELPDGMRVGETWELVDRDAENSVIAGGAWRGRTLRELMQAHGGEVLGEAHSGADGRFPLLIKYLDAAADLSVQVHPDEEAARVLGGDAEAKTEAWCVLDVDAGGVLYAGLRDDVEEDEFSSVADGPGVVDLLQRWEVQPGDCMLIRGGTVHAIGAGVRILEVQQNSDTTLRLYDWGRVGLDGQPRPTHRDAALACVRYGVPCDPATPAWSEHRPGVEQAQLADAPTFGMRGLRLTAELAHDTGRSFRVYAVTHGGGALELADGRRWPLGTGEVWLLPACLGAHRLCPGPDGMTLVDVFPQAMPTPPGEAPGGG